MILMNDREDLTGQVGCFFYFLMRRQEHKCSKEIVRFVNNGEETP